MLRPFEAWSRSGAHSAASRVHAASGRKLTSAECRETAPTRRIYGYPLFGYTRVVIRTFADAGTEDLFDGRNSKAARQQLPQSLWSRARRMLDQLQRAQVIGDMAQPPGNRLERLSAGRYSVRVNDQYRVTFRWEDGAAEEVWCGDYHD